VSALIDYINNPPFEKAALNNAHRIDTRTFSSE
jgi:hypothetical protein